MSATNFYRTLYQTDQLFRVAGESWAGETTQSLPAQPAFDELPTTPEMPNLLDELDTLSATADTPAIETLLVDTVTSMPTAVVLDPEPVVLIAAPEPLPEPVPRPTIPSVVPPVQQVQLPQLNHKVLLLADEELDPGNLLFLEKILKAVNLNIDGVDLMNLNGARDLDFAELVQDKKIHHFITFGVPFSRIHLDIAMDRYHPIRFFGINFLMADSLPTIEADLALKKRLWGALKRIFLQP